MTTRKVGNMPGKKVVVLGGGFGGARAAITARRLLSPEHEVTLVDRSRRTYICGSLPLLIVGEKDALKASRSLGQIRNRGVTYAQTEVTRIDLDNRVLRTGSATHEYDYLVLAAGAEYDWDAIPNARLAHSFYNLEAARRLRRALSGFKRGRIVIAISGLPYKCPPAPFEAAMIIRWALERSGRTNGIDIHLYTPEPAPIPVAGPEASACVEADLASRHIQLHPNAALKEVAKDGKSASFTDGSTMDAELIITVPVHRVARVIADSGITDGKPWVPVNPGTLETTKTGIYAVGDSNMVMMANSRALPKAGIFASTEGEVAGKNVAAAINGTSPSRFSGDGYCFIAYSGREAGRVTGSFLAPEKPQVTFEQPSRAGFKAKEKFEADWRRFRL
ncbi:MAG: NAD(P)/FAD-dependent oxidoreductase [Chloroflexi bacterium]|nr:NAD(P)/FAD-dependent oxidoreductase [Chloroflexota bacterium]